MRSRIALFLVFVVAAAACATEPAVDPGSQRSSPANVESTTAPAPVDTPATSPASTATRPDDAELVPVQMVLDGDSLAVERDGRRTEVRLAGINTPESGECFGDDARNLTRQLAGDEVVLVPVEGEDDLDQFGRLLRNVWADETWINLELVRNGAAIALQTGTPDEAALVAAEDIAWQEGRGLWGSTVCGGFTAGPRVTDIRFDPPGRDFENKEEEFLLIANEGDEPVDIGGWIIRDESSTHRYRFPAGTTLAPGEGVRLRTGCGSDGERDLYWCADDAVWSNGGDTAILQTASGTVVDRWKYPGDD